MCHRQGATCHVSLLIITKVLAKKNSPIFEPKKKRFKDVFNLYGHRRARTKDVLHDTRVFHFPPAAHNSSVLREHEGSHEFISKQAATCMRRRLSSKTHGPPSLPWTGTILCGVHICSYVHTSHTKLSCVLTSEFPSTTQELRSWDPRSHLA